MTPPTIDILRVEGSHREVGRQLGEMGRDRIQDELATAFDDLPAGSALAISSSNSPPATVTSRASGSPG